MRTLSRSFVPRLIAALLIACLVSDTGLSVSDTGLLSASTLRVSQEGAGLEELRWRLVGLEEQGLETRGRLLEEALLDLAKFLPQLTQSRDAIEVIAISEANPPPIEYPPYLLELTKEEIHKLLIWVRSRAEHLERLARNEQTIKGFKADLAIGDALLERDREIQQHGPQSAEDIEFLMNFEYFVEQPRQRPDQERDQSSSLVRLDLTYVPSLGRLTVRIYAPTVFDESPATGLEEPGGAVDPMAWWQGVPAALDRWQAIAATLESARNGQQLQRHLRELQEAVLSWNARNGSPEEHYRTLGVALVIARAAAGADLPIELRVPLVSTVLVAGIIPRWPSRPDPKIQPLIQHLQEVIQTGGIKEPDLAHALVDHWLPFVRPGRRGPDVNLDALPAVDRRWIRQHQKDLLLANKLLWAADRLGPYLLPGRFAADHFELWQRNLPYLSALREREPVETLLASLDPIDPVHRLIWDKTWEALVTQFLKELPYLSRLGRAWILNDWWTPPIQQGVAQRVASVLRQPKGSPGDGQLRRLSGRVLTPLQKERLRGGAIPQLILLGHDGQVYLLKDLAEYNRGTRRWLLAPLTTGESVIRIKSPKELIQGFVFLIDSLGSSQRTGPSASLRAGLEEGRAVKAPPVYRRWMGELEVAWGLLPPDHWTTEMFLDLITQQPWRFKEKRILEYGTGVGTLAFALPRAGARQVVGVDISEKAVDFARRNLAKQPWELQQRIRFGISDLDAQLPAEGPYEVAIFNNPIRTYPQDPNDPATLAANAGEDFEVIKRAVASLPRRLLPTGSGFFLALEYPSYDDDTWTVGDLKDAARTMGWAVEPTGISNEFYVRYQRRKWGIFRLFNPNAGLEEVGWSFGPVSPAQELRQRKDNFRSAFIAVRSTGHKSSNPLQLDLLLSQIFRDLKDLSQSKGIDTDLMLGRAAWISDVYVGIYSEASRQALQRFEGSEEHQGQSPDLLSLLGALSENLSSFAEKTKILRGDDAEIEVQQIIHRIKENVIQAKGWVIDRAALAHRESPEGATISFSEIRRTFLSNYEHHPLVIEATPEAEAAQVPMTSLRLFSLLSNLISNALGHLPADGKAILRLELDPISQELVIRVDDNGTGIEPDYFGRAPDGMIRLFALEERGWRVPLGLAEVWDTVAIANGRLAVETLREDEWKKAKPESLGGGDVSFSEGAQSIVKEFYPEIGQHLQKWIHLVEELEGRKVVPSKEDIQVLQKEQDDLQDRISQRYSQGFKSEETWTSHLLRTPAYPIALTFSLLRKDPSNAEDARILLGQKEEMHRVLKFFHRTAEGRRTEPGTTFTVWLPLAPSAPEGAAGLEERVVQIGSAKLELVLGDITQQKVDAVVNAGNSLLVEGGGVDGAIHAVGGPSLRREHNATHPHGILPGQAVLTGGGQLPARYVIHAVGPVFSGRPDDARVLASVYHTSLELASRHGIHSIAFPSLSTGAYLYPVEEAAPIAIATVAAYLRQHPEIHLVRFALFDGETYRAYDAALTKQLAGAAPQPLPLPDPLSNDPAVRRLQALRAILNLIVLEAPIQYDYWERLYGQGGVGRSLDAFLTSFGTWHLPEIQGSGLTPMDLEYLVSGHREQVQSPAAQWVGFLMLAYLAAEQIHADMQEGLPWDGQRLLRNLRQKLMARGDFLQQHSAWATRWPTDEEILALIDRTREAAGISLAGLEEVSLDQEIVAALKLLGTREDKGMLLGGGGESGRAAIKVFEVLEKWAATHEAVLSPDRLADAVVILREADEVWGLKDAKELLQLLVDRRRSGAGSEELRRLFLGALDDFRHEHDGQGPSRYVQAEWFLKEDSPPDAVSQIKEIQGLIEMGMPREAIVRILRMLERIIEEAQLDFTEWAQAHRLFVRADARLRGYQPPRELGEAEEEGSGGGLELADRSSFFEGKERVEAQEPLSHYWEPVVRELARFVQKKAKGQHVRHFLERYLTGHRDHYGEDLSETLRREWGLGPATGLEEAKARVLALEKVRAAGWELRDGEFGKALRELDRQIGGFLSQSSPDFENAPIEEWIGLIKQAERHNEEVVRRLDSASEYVPESIYLTLSDEFGNDLSTLSLIVRVTSSATQFVKAQAHSRFILQVVDELASIDGWREWYIAKKPDSALLRDLHGLRLRTDEQGASREAYQNWAQLDGVIRGILPKIEEGLSVETGWIISFESAKRAGLDLLVAAFAQKGRKLPIAFIAETDFRKESLMLAGVPGDQIKGDIESAFGWLALAHRLESAILVFDQEYGQPALSDELSSYLFPIELHTFVEMLGHWLDLAGIGVEAQAVEKLKEAITAYAA